MVRFFILAGKEDKHESLVEKFGQILLLTTELAALEHLKNRCRHFSSVATDQIHFKFIGNECVWYSFVHVVRSKD